MKVLEKRHEVLSDFMEPVELVDQMDLFAPKGSSWTGTPRPGTSLAQRTPWSSLAQWPQSLPQAPPKCRPTTQGKDGDTNVHSHVAADWTQRKASKPLVCCNSKALVVARNRSVDPAKRFCNVRHLMSRSLRGNFKQRHVNSRVCSVFLCVSSYGPPLAVFRTASRVAKRSSCPSDIA